MAYRSSFVDDNLYGIPDHNPGTPLHAYRLAFLHPVGDTPLEITRTLPDDLRKILY